MKRTILILGPKPTLIGGVSVHVLRETALLSSNLWRCYVVSLSGWFASGKNICNIFKAIYLFAYALCFSILGKFNVVHIHYSRWFYSIPFFLIFERRNIPYILTIHSNTLFRDFETLSEKRTKRLLDGIGNANRIIAVNDSIKSKLVEKNIPESIIDVLPAYLPPSSWEFSPNCLNSKNRLLYKTLSESTNSILVTSAYNLGPGHGIKDVYGLELLFSTIGKLEQSLLGEISLLIFVSRSPSDSIQKNTLTRLNELSDEFKSVKLHVFFCESMLPFLAISNGYLRPSRTDGDSVAVREALALGIPVAASDVINRPLGVMTFSLNEENLRKAILHIVQAENNPVKYSGKQLNPQEMRLLRIIDNIGW